MNTYIPFNLVAEKHSSNAVHSGIAAHKNIATNKQRYISQGKKVESRLE
jgi:hypothetical protein